MAPIVLFAYNRPLHLRRTVEALVANDGAAESTLIVYSDGARDAKASRSVEEVRTYLKTVKGFRSVRVIERAENCGLARSIMEGVTEVVREFGTVIVLEDDHLTAPSFLRFMNDGLAMYAHDDSVISIHGYSYPTKQPLPDLYFMRGADCFGWATWKRGWDVFNPDTAALRNAVLNGGEVDQFTFNNSFPYIRIFDEDIRGVRRSWAIRWYASAFLAGKFTLYPGRSLVQHIGNDGSGTNMGGTDVFRTELSTEPVRMSRIPIQESAEARKAWEEFFWSIRPGLVRRIYGGMKRELSYLFRS